ncbi:MAG TPA: ribonucleotide-diphosphate reductase subunit beta [Ktedonobacteraceae bacterium]|nr:ribonucleotide-diphosphate reductase subunit beta [Ktedonobacteraceae bacterium]
MSIDMPLESAPLAQLQQTPIDRVLNIIDEGLVHLPTYAELYDRWERQQWLSQELDFSVDRKQWEGMGEDERRMRINGLSAFFKGEECVTNTLAPYVTAMPEDDMRIFVTTQLVDESRHTVFFARFFKEALGIDQGTLEGTLDVVTPNLNADLRYILIDALNEVAERIRQQPGELSYLVEGVTLYHIVVEGMMALAGQRGILQAYREQDIFPAFRAGFTAVARDESRHVIFGVKFLREMIQRDRSMAEVVHDAIQKYAQTALDAISVPKDQEQRLLDMGEDPWMTPRYGVDSLRKKIKVIGLEMPMPSVPPPPF